MTSNPITHLPKLLVDKGLARTRPDARRLLALGEVYINSHPMPWLDLDYPHPVYYVTVHHKKVKV